MNGALLIHKHAGASSFGIIEILQRQWMDQHQCRKRELPKMGHGGTLDPFATGLLVVLVGNGVKLAQYMLGASKVYEGIMAFGITTIPGDPTDPISETSSILPESLEALRNLADQMSQQPYLQTPPMHSAKKLHGKPLYTLARQGIEVEREAKTCHLSEFEFQNYHSGRAPFRVRCSSGTYIRTLTQDVGKKLGTVALLEKLHRTDSGIFSIHTAWTTDQILESTRQGRKWSDLPCWMPFHRLLDGYAQAEATPEEQLALAHGKQQALLPILERVKQPARHSADKALPYDCIAITCNQALVAVARRKESIWSLDRVFL